MAKFPVRFPSVVMPQVLYITQCYTDYAWYLTLQAEQPQPNVIQNCTALESLQVTAKNSKLPVQWAGLIHRLCIVEGWGGRSYIRYA